MAASPEKTAPGPPGPLPVVLQFTDYSRWERKTPLKAPAVPSRLPAALNRTLLSPRLHHPHQTRCRHGHGPARSREKAPTLAHLVSKPPPPSSSKLSPSPGSLRTGGERAPLSPGVKLLKMQVATKRKAVAEYQDHREKLLVTNLSLISSIQDTEESTHTTVQELLEKYQKFKGTLSTLKHRSTKDVTEAQTELNATREHLNSKIEDLRREVSQASAALQDSTQDLQVLLHYKEKEHPVKLARIEQLKEQVEFLASKNKFDFSELEYQVEEEREKCEQQMEAIRVSLEVQATEASIARMKRSVREKAIQNRIMEKEMQIHRQKIEEALTCIKSLRSRIRKLKQNVKDQSLKRQPFLSLGKCQPDSDLKLDIPIQHDSLV